MLLFPFALPSRAALRAASVRPLPPPAVLRPRYSVLVLQWTPGPEHARPYACRVTSS